MRVPTIVVAVLAGFLASAAAQAGDIWKYVDETGKTLYTDKPIPGAVLVSTGSQRPPEAAQRAFASQQSATNNQLSASNQRIAQGQDDARVAAQVAKDLEATRAERCKTARSNYQQSLNTRRLYTETPDGKRTFLSEEDLVKARVDAAKAVEAICGPQG
jgi:hypothetical protein